MKIAPVSTLPPKPVTPLSPFHATVDRAARSTSGAIRDLLFHQVDGSLQLAQRAHELTGRALTLDGPRDALAQVREGHALLGSAIFHLSGEAPLDSPALKQLQAASGLIWSAADLTRPATAA